MAARLLPGFRKLFDFSELQFTEIGARRRRRRMVLAFVTGLALFAGSAAAMVSQGALARGPGIGFFQSLSQPAPSYHTAYTQLPLAPSGDTAAPKKHHKKVAASTSLAANFSTTRPVCVRLCDGAFFPVSNASNTTDAQSACASQCPDAPTALYYQPAGSDKIEDAVSSVGERYGILPVALRYRATHDNTCTCHREIAGDINPFRDHTLRRGDAVMTAKGFLVFQGDGRSDHTPRDFTALAKAPLPKDQRTTLQEIERVSLIARPAAAPVTLATAPVKAPVLLTAANRDVIRFVEAPVSRTN